ncbi:unnamed protein product [Rotaria sordida]|uniref:Uncharacterized protein n=1 Tax=Rotaria sordida TaxID=392033 RepID=A0A815F347_9BILA|nr:unnamed protein product [Rotaria sordida]CAF1323667.1 unnamed protein product [Rotaria sordida]CAF3784358.1 unnamed protein product [Rotaria sordida]CAF3791004.1 unnamed protein product [Rotaria sordida]
MRIVFRLLLIVALVAVLVHSQGARGGSRGGGSRGGSRYRGGGTSRGSSCQGSDCRKVGIIVGSVIGGILGLIAVIFLIIFCCRRYRGRPSESNTSFINKNSTNELNKTYQTYEENYFKNGDWMSRYYQYGQWHGPHLMSLTFDHATGQVTGHGYDDVGKFTIDGTFSEENQRIALNKTYALGTGDPKENSGHAATIQLTWNTIHGQFEGKWFVQTSNYRGEDKFELKFGGSSESFLEKRAD